MCILLQPLQFAGDCEPSSEKETSLFILRGSQVSHFPIYKGPKPNNWILSELEG